MSLKLKAAAAIAGGLVLSFLVVSSLYAQNIWEGMVAPQPNQSRAGDKSFPRRIIVEMKQIPNSVSMMSLANNLSGESLEGSITSSNSLVYSVDNVSQALAAARSNPNVASARVEPRIFANKIPNDTNFGFQWSLPNMKVAGDGRGAWELLGNNLSAGTGNIKVAITDTGVDRDHPDLVGKFDTTKPQDWVDCTQKDADGSDCKKNYSRDNFGHGTHVAGIIGAMTDNSRGIAGVGYNVKLMSVRILGDDGSGGLLDAIKGIKWAADNEAKIINMSWGATAPEMTSKDIADLQEAIDYAWEEKGAILVAAAGNCGTGVGGCNIAPGVGAGTPTPIPTIVVNPQMYPAVSNHVISVAALRKSNALAPYSESGTWVDIAAPGGYFICPETGDCTQARNGILSTFPDYLIEDQPPAPTPKYNYAYMIGTSMAAPQVSGVVALIWAAQPALTRDQVESTLFTYANKTVAGTGTDFKEGMVNACASIYAALHDGASPPATECNNVTSTGGGGDGGGITPTPFPGGAVCPKDCKQFNSAYTGKDRKQGDYNCNGNVNKKDFNVFKKQFAKIPNKDEKNNANGTCQDTGDTRDPGTFLVDLVDFEKWRRNTTNFGQIGANDFEDEEGD